MKKPYVIGLNINGTNTVFGLVDARGNVISKGVIKTGIHDDINLYVNDIFNGLMPLIEVVGGTDKIKGIGVGAPNGNYYTGNIEHAPNLLWKGIIPFAKLMTEKFGIPAALTNDANAATVGEMTYGIARGLRNFIMVTLGAGVGSGIVIDGKLIYGHDGFAGELGHTNVLRNNGRLCSCGRNGCLEAYASTTGIARTAREILDLNPKESLLRNISLDDITLNDIYEAAIQGDKIALEIFQYTGELLGEAFANFVAFSAPEAIILFGELTKAKNLILKPITKNMETNLLPIWKGKVKVLFSELKESSNAVILGASSLAWEL